MLQIKLLPRIDKHEITPVTLYLDDLKKIEGIVLSAGLRPMYKTEYAEEIESIDELLSVCQNKEIDFLELSACSEDEEKLIVVINDHQVVTSYVKECFVAAGAALAIAEVLKARRTFWGRVFYGRINQMLFILIAFSIMIFVAFKVKGSGTQTQKGLLTSDFIAASLLSIASALFVFRPIIVPSRIILAEKPPRHWPRTLSWDKLLFMILGGVITLIIGSLTPILSKLLSTALLP